MTILSFAAVFTGLGLGASPDWTAATMLVSGVFVGSACWWLLLSGGVGLLRSRVTPAWMRVVNRISGAVLLAFGLYALATVLFQSTPEKGGH
jgi:putative LysE/RhtB family amino acid efflux pump